MMGNWGYGGYGMMGGFGWIGMALFWIVLILAIAWLWKALNLGKSIRDTNFGQPSPNRAIDIARERLAKGEINREEFEQLKQALR